MAFFESHPDRIEVNPEHIIGTWHALIPDAAGRGEDFFRAVEDALKELMPGNVATERKEIKVESSARPCLRIADGEVMSEYGRHFFFSTEDFGKHLILSRIIELKEQRVERLFDAEKTSAFLAIISAATETAKKSLLGGKEDFTMANAKSDGIIDIA